MHRAPAAVFDDVIGQELAIEVLRCGGGGLPRGPGVPDGRDDPCLAVHRTAGFRPVGRRQSFRRGTGVRVRRLWAVLALPHGAGRRPTATSAPSPRRA